MLIGSNPRREAAVLNARIRKRYLKGNVLIGVVGEKPIFRTPTTISAPARKHLRSLSNTPRRKRKADVHYWAGRA